MISDKNNKKKNTLPKVEEMIIHGLNEVLLRDLILPKDTLITLNRLKLYADISHAIVYYTVLPDNKRGTAKRFFKEKKKSIEHFFKKRVNLNRIPKLFFRYDSDEMESRAFSDLLDSAFATLPEIKEDSEE